MLMLTQGAAYAPTGNLLCAPSTPESPSQQTSPPSIKHTRDQPDARDRPPPLAALTVPSASPLTPVSWSMHHLLSLGWLQSPQLVLLPPLSPQQCNLFKAGPDQVASLHRLCHGSCRQRARPLTYFSITFHDLPPPTPGASALTGSCLPLAPRQAPARHDCTLSLDSSTQPLDRLFPLSPHCPQVFPVTLHWNGFSTSAAHISQSLALGQGHHSSRFTKGRKQKIIC